MDSKQREKNRVFLEGFESLVYTLFAMLLLLSFVVRTAPIDGSSMQGALNDGDQVLLYILFYTPQRGDVVAIDTYTGYGKPLVKRVIALGGDVVDLDPISGGIMLNGVLLDEPYTTEATLPADVPFPVIVPEGHLFVLGDNRADSKDSRYSEIGFIDERAVMGKVILRLFPTGDFGAIA